MLGKSQTLEALKQQVAALETQPLLKDADSLMAPAGLLATPRGCVRRRPKSTVRSPCAPADRDRHRLSTGVCARPPCR